MATIFATLDSKKKAGTKGECLSAEWGCKKVKEPWNPPKSQKMFSPGVAHLFQNLLQMLGASILQHLLKETPTDLSFACDSQPHHIARALEWPGRQPYWSLAVG